MIKTVFLGSIFFTGVYALLFTKSATENEQHVSMPETLSEIIAAHKIYSGDIVFRLGHGYISETLKNLSQEDKRYSHAGIISMENGMPYVYHLMGSESDNATLRRDMLTDFCLPSAAQCYALYHVNKANLDRSSVDSLNKYFLSHALPFDKRFDIETDSAMYCTEYVYKILNHASGGHFLIISSELSGFRFIGCDDIYLNEDCQKIFAYSYREN
jgi:hypothetical protein